MGYAAEAVQAAVSFAFSHFRIHRLAAFIHAGNTLSRKLAERIGMLLVDGIYGDECVYGLLESDFIIR
ncbi:MAG: GNAT family N-acetyltransferase [Clostridiaceae bacterium]|nr:GNAT family N-acetyltransferase [Clostridiaceae bacterium]